MLQRVIISSVIGDANALFWAITGCFIFSGNRTFKGILIKFLKSIFVPAIICVILVQIFYGWIDAPYIGFNIQQLSKPDIKEIFLGIIQFDVLHFGDCVKHYWYIFEYCKAVMLFPVLELLTRDENKKKLYYVLGLYLASISFNEILVMISPEYKVVRFDYFSIPCMEILWGFLIYKTVRKRVFDFQNNRLKCSLCGVVVVVMTIVLAVFAQYRIYSVYGYDTSINYMGWNSSFAFIMILGYMMAVLPIGVFLAGKGGIRRNVVSWIASAAFPVYLIHGVVIHKLNVIGFSDGLYNALDKVPKVREFVYVVIMTMIVAGLSVVLYGLLRALKQMLYAFLKALRTRN